MTPSRYFLARIAQAFGIHRKNKRMSDAATEMHLLRDAETVLGAAVWERVESIEELSVEYWNLRRLIKERDQIRERVQQCHEQLEVAHAERSSLLNHQLEPHDEIGIRRQEILDRLEDLAHERDQIVSRAKEVRRSYDGLKMKLEVLAAEADPGRDDIPALRTKLEELKKSFSELKIQRAEVGERIAKGDEELDALEQQLSERRQERRNQASEAFQVIGEANREISTYRAELGLIETRIRQLYAEVGRYVSRNRGRNPLCNEVSRDHQGMVEVMRCLRASISMNHKLSGQA